MPCYRSPCYLKRAPDPAAVSLVSPETSVPPDRVPRLPVLSISTTWGELPEFTENAVDARDVGRPLAGTDADDRGGAVGAVARDARVADQDVVAFGAGGAVTVDVAGARSRAYQCVARAGDQAGPGPVSKGGVSNAGRIGTERIVAHGRVACAGRVGVERGIARGRIVPAAVAGREAVSPRGRVVDSRCWS